MIRFGVLLILLLFLNDNVLGDLVRPDKLPMLKNLLEEQKKRYDQLESERKEVIESSESQYSRYQEKLDNAQNEILALEKQIDALEHE